MKKPTVIEMPHPGHFICASDCMFRRNTYVNGFIVSTVGELKGSDYEKLAGRKATHAELYRTLGIEPDSFYETMVFKATKSKHKCCPYVADVSAGEQECVRYADEGAAVEGHAKLVKKYAKEQP